MSKSSSFTWLYAAKIKPTLRKQIALFRLRLCCAVPYRMPQRRILTLLARSSRYVATHTIAAPRIPVPKRLDHLSDEFFFKFFINFRPRVFVFARQFVVKFRHIAAAFAVELDRVSPYGAVF